MKNDVRPAYLARPVTPLVNRAEDAQPLRFLDQVRTQIRVKHYVLRTGRAHLHRLD